MQLQNIEKAFSESYILQTSVGDLPSAAGGFDALVRSRRGTPYNAVATTVKKNADTWPDKRTDTGGGGGGANDGGTGVGALDALEAFVERHEGVVLEFTARAANNLAYVNSKVSFATTRTRRKPGMRAYHREKT